MADPQDIFSRAMRPEDSLDGEVGLKKPKPAEPETNADPFANLLTPEQDLLGSSDLERATKAKQYQRDLDTYTNLKGLAEVKYQGNPEGLEEELQKVQLSMYLGQQLSVDPEQVHRGWNSLGENPYAAQYFESSELPKTYWGYMKEDIERAAKTYRAMNIATGLFATPYREGKYDKLLEVLKSMPEDTTPKARAIGKGGVLDFIASIPQAIISQAPYLADMGLAGLAGQLIGGGIGSLFGPEGTAAGAAAGRQAAAFLAGTRLGTASIFMDAMTMIDPETERPIFESVKDPRELEDIARWSAAIWGGVEGAIGMLQLESLLGKGVLNKAAQQSTSKAMRTVMAETMKKYGKNLAFQTGTEPIQEIFELVGTDLVAANVNQREGKALPRATAGDFARLAATTADVTFRSSLLFTLPGSVIEAKASLAEKLAAWDTANKQKRMENVNRLTDISRPVVEREADIQARLGELRKAQSDLEGQIDAWAEGHTFNEESVRAYQANKAEMDYLEWAQREAEQKAPTNPYMNTRDVAVANGLLPGGGDALAQPEAPARPEAPPAPEPQPRTESPSAVLRGSKATSFRGLTAEQITPEVERRLKDELFLNPDGSRIQTADELNQNQVLVVTGGVAGASKTTVIEQTGRVKENKVVVNLDIPEEMTGLTDPVFHETSRRITNELLKEAMDGGYHVTYDSPMTDFTKIDGLIQEVLGKDGTAVIAYSWIDPDTSRARNKLRTLLMEENKETIRNVDPAGTAKGWNRSVPTLVELYKKYKNNPRVRFTIVNNNVDLASPKPIMRNNVVVDQAALDDLLATEYVEARGEKGETYYTRTGSSAETAESLQVREDAAIRRGIGIRDRLRAAARDRNQKDAGIGASQGPPQLAAPDLSPTSPIVSTIREGLPNLTVEQAQGAALYAKLLASHDGMSLDEWVRDRFVKGIFSTDLEKKLEAEQRRGAIAWNDVGKAIFYTTTNSDFGTWVHELTHLFEYDLDERERAAVNRWLGAGYRLSEDQKEQFAYSVIDYIRKGHVPSEDLRPVFDRMARWLNQIYHADLDWKISDEIVQMYDEILAGQSRQPQTHEAEYSEIVFETRPAAEQQDPAKLRPEDFLLLTDYNRKLRETYIDPQTGRARPGIVSNTTPSPPMPLTVGMWMVDSEVKGIHGHEIAQLRLLDPNTLQLSEDDYTTGVNYEGRGDDARRYAEWMAQGMTPPPISVVETDRGNLKVSDGHRRTAAAKMANQQILAWVYPAMDHPNPEMIDSSTGKIMRVGMTYEGATGQAWPGDVKPPAPAEAQRQMSYETRPGDKDPWILKSREVVRQKMRGPQPAANVKSMLESSGVKAEEMEWLGLNDFLKGSKKVTPEEVLNHIEANAIEIKEIVLTIPSDAALEAKVEELRQEEVENEAFSLYDRAISEANYPNTDISERTDDEGNPEWVLMVDSGEVETFDTEEEAEAEAEQIRARFEDEVRESVQDKAETIVNRMETQNPEYFRNRAMREKPYRDTLPKYQEYKIPGGQHYRELLMTMPDTPKTKGKPQPAGSFYIGPHWSQPNVLLHVRFDERTGSDGKRILFIEEIQSDWHQKGRERGYAKDPGKLPDGFSIRRLTQEVIEAEWPDADTVGIHAGDWALFEGEVPIGGGQTGEMTEAQAREKIISQAEQTIDDFKNRGGKPSGVPDAPFKKTWPELAMRRMIRWATENGFDEIAWTTGEQQAERYSLAKHAKTLYYNPATNNLVAFTDLPNAENRHAGRPAFDQTVPPEKLADYVGKEVARKLLESPLKKQTLIDLPATWRMDKSGDFWNLTDETGQTVAQQPGRLTTTNAILEFAAEHPEYPWVRSNVGPAFHEILGDDLKVGGEGMRGFYDEMLVSVARKIGKKYGAKVETTAIEGDAESKVTDEVYRQALDKVNRAHRDENGTPDDIAILANQIDGWMTDESDTFAGAIESARDAQIAYESTIDALVAEVDAETAKNAVGYRVHNLEIPDAMKTDVREGQMLFEPGPHELSVQQAVRDGLPVPDQVLQEYIDREWAQAEADRRTKLVEAARTFSSFDDFIDWQAKSSPEGFPNHAYYENLWNRAQQTKADPAIQSRSFREAIQDDETIHWIIGGYAMVHEEDLSTQGVITDEMKELGRRLLAGENTEDLTKKVRTQMEDSPRSWINYFEKYLPDDVKADLKSAMEAEQEEFVPVLPKVANERFTRNLQREGNLEEFLTTVGPYRLEGKSKVLSTLAGRLRDETDFSLDAVMRYRAMREIRRSITTYREAYATATQDEDMLRQLYAEADIAVETEEARLKTENQRLRAEMKKALAEVRQANLKQLWTMKDLDNTRRENEALEKKYLEDIAAAKEQLKLSVQEVRQTLQNKATVEGVISSTLHKKRMAEVKKRNEANVAILKARVKQVRELGRQRVQAERDKARVHFYAQYINRPVNAGIADYQARQIEDIQARIAYDPDDVPDTILNKLREWRRRNPTAPMPSDLVQKIEASNPRKITAGEMAKLYEEVKALRTQGRKVRMQQMLTERNYVTAEIGKVVSSVRGKKEPRDLKGYGTKGTLKAVKTPAAKKAMWATWRMNRIAEMIDGGRKGPVTDWLWDQVNDKTDESLRIVEAYTQENEKRLAELSIRARDLGKQETIDGLKITHGQMIGVYVYSQFEDGKFSLVEDNRIPEATIANIIKALSPEEKEYGDWMIDRLSSDADFDRLQEVQLLVANQRMDRLRRYFPMQRQGLSGNPLLSDLAKELLDMAGKTNKPRPRSGFLKSRMDRVEGVSFPPLRLDAPAIYMDHITKREFYIANALLIKRLNRIFDSREVKAALNDRHGDAMLPLIQKYVAQYTNPNIYRAFEDYGEFARLLRGNIGMSLIGHNVMTMFRQIPDIPQIMLMAGPVDGMRAAAQFIASPKATLEAMWEKAPQLKQRSYDRFIEEMKSLDRNAYERVVKTVGEAGFAVLKAMDTATNAIGWTAIYNKTMRRTGNEAMAVKAARDFILKKRPAARAKDVAAIYRSPGLAWFLMFTNQQNQQWNILTYDIPHAIKEGLRGNGAAMLDAAMNVTGLLVGAIGMGLVARKGRMEASDLLEDFLNMLFGNTPFIGNAFESAIRGQPAQDALNPFAGAYQLGKIGYDVANKAETEKVMRDLQNALFTLAGTAGFPVIQAKRIYKTVLSGDPWDLIGGPPKKED